MRARISSTTLASTRLAAAFGLAQRFVWHMGLDPGVWTRDLYYAASGSVAGVWLFS